MICQTDRITILQLRFDLRRAFPVHEKLTQAQLKLRFQLLADKKHFFEDSSQHHVEISVYGFKDAIDQRTKTNELCLENPARTEFRVFLDQIPGYARTKSEYQLSNDLTAVVDLLPILHAYKAKFQRGAARIIVEVNRFEQVANSWLSVSKSSLLLVSLDRRQCPLSVTSQTSTTNIAAEGDMDILRNRIKRDLSLSATKTHSGDGDKEPTSHSRRSATRSSICREHKMWVSFSDMEWGKWIIAPKGFYANRCHGECPFPLGDKLNATNHAMLMTLMNSAEPRGSPLPCCVPTHLTPISLLYFDSGGNVVLRQYEDMIVQSCGCR